jgi:hypothetical protein
MPRQGGGRLTPEAWHQIRAATRPHELNGGNKKALDLKPGPEVNYAPGRPEAKPQGALAADHLEADQVDKLDKAERRGIRRALDHLRSLELGGLAECQLRDKQQKQRPCSEYFFHKQ